METFIHILKIIGWCGLISMIISVIGFLILLISYIFNSSKEQYYEQPDTDLMDYKKVKSMRDKNYCPHKENLGL
jgi:hypothetical protein